MVSSCPAALVRVVGKAGYGSYPEVATIEHTVRVDDHKGHLPAEEVICLLPVLSHPSQVGGPDADAYLDVDPFLFLECM